jgi:hypothetical protein
MRKNGDSLVLLLTKVNVAHHFARVASGKWTCINPIGFSTIRGRIDIALGTTFTVGTNFAGVDMAFLLDREYERQHTSGEARAAESRRSKAALSPPAQTEMQEARG